MSRRIGTPNVPGLMDRRIKEHQAILAALERRDADLAERLWRDHILAGGEETIKLIEEVQVPTKSAKRVGGGEGLHNTQGDRTP